MPQDPSISDSVRRWTLLLGQLRSRALRVKRRSAPEPSAGDGLLDEALEFSNRMLIDLAGAELELKKSRHALAAEREHASALFDRMPIATVMTDRAGLITAANRRATQLLNVSARHLAGRPLVHFSNDRTAYLALLRGLPLNGTASTGTLTIRPRERRTLNVEIAIVPRTPADATEWVWFLTPDTGNRAGESKRVQIRPDADDGNGHQATSHGAIPSSTRI